VKFTEQDLQNAFARNSALRKRNPEISGAPYPESLRPVEPEPVKRRALVRRVPREEKSGPRFEIVFTIYARRPCDWDGYHVKPLQDMLIHAGYLPGDSWHELEGRIRSRRVQTVEEERTEVEIIPL
jgi:hypothetical protein